MHKLIVMGVSGCGKSTLGAGIATALECPLIEGDDHHLPESKAKMRKGIALQDSDREPWLDRLAELMSAHSGDVVLTCSALKRRYRDRLRARVPGIKFVFIDIDEAQAPSACARARGISLPIQPRGEPVRGARIARRRARRAAACRRRSRCKRK